MEVKYTSDMWGLLVRRKLRISDIRQTASEISPLIEDQIKEEKLQINGPWLFISYNLPKNGKTFFDWEIFRPVQKPDNYYGKIELCHLLPIKVASIDYRGTLRSLFTKGYMPFVAAIEASHHNFSGESREVYHFWDTDTSMQNHIEIQFGLSE